MALKGNHPTLSRAARDWFASYTQSTQTVPHGVRYSHCESGHHRIESRVVWQFPVAEVFDSIPVGAWAGLQTLVVVENTRQLWNKHTREVRFYLSSVQADAQTFAGYIRAHWGIENQLHWCLDVTFSEDRCRVRKDYAPRNLSLLRRLALNLLRQDKSKYSLKMKRFKAAMDNQFLLKILLDSGTFCL